MPVSCLGPIGKEMLLIPSVLGSRSPLCPEVTVALQLGWRPCRCQGWLASLCSSRAARMVQEYCSFLPSTHRHSDSFVPYRQQLTTHSGTRVGAFPGRPLQLNRAFHRKPANIKANIPPPQNCLSSDSAICIILWGLVQEPGFLANSSKFYLGILPFLIFILLRFHPEMSFQFCLALLTYGKKWKDT